MNQGISSTAVPKKVVTVSSNGISTKVEAASQAKAARVSGGVLRSENATGKLGVSGDTWQEVQGSASSGPAATSGETPIRGDRNSAPSRPTGEDENAYKGWGKWSPRRWAWEFLTRNEQFRSECDKVNSEDVIGQSDIAEKFGLKRFKDYREPYKLKAGNGAGQRPVFIHGAISVRSNMDPKKEKGRKVSFTLEYGQVAIVFNLAEAMDHDTALGAQIQAATNSLRRRQQKYMKDSSKNEIAIRAPHHTAFQKYLRILDLLAAGKNKVQTMRIVNGDLGATVAELRDQKKQQIPRAIACAESRYRHIANMQNWNKKPVKSGPPLA